MMTFYAAVGSYRMKDQDGHMTPYIQKLGKLHPVSIPEFMIWSLLLWEVMTYDEVKNLYDELQSNIENAQIPPFDEMLDLLVKRKLVIRGIGYTGMDALFNMLSDAFVLPYCASLPKRAWIALRLLIKGKIRLSDIFQALRQDQMSDEENRVIRLIEQTPLSTAEIIRCFERKIYDVSSAEKVIAGIYSDGESDQARIANEENLSEYKRPVLQAVANLYLNRHVILEVV